MRCRPIGVIEGDQAGAADSERIRAAGAPVVQINTDSGCHLDAGMVERGLAELAPGLGSIVFIENVGNLVCPALFDLGERAKVVIFSATEGEDKPLKYPHMFGAATLIILNKTDLLPHLDFSVEQAIANVRQVNPDAPILQLSARTGEGLSAWNDWLQGEAARAGEFASSRSPESGQSRARQHRNALTLPPASLRPGSVLPRITLSISAASDPALTSR